MIRQWLYALFYYLFWPLTWALESPRAGGNESLLEDFFHALSLWLLIVSLLAPWIGH